jgi:CubicO group peptidase (beta-lactamase class C family)
MKNIIFYLFLCAGLISSTILQAQVFDKNELEATIDSLIPTQVNDTTPGLVIGIVQKGELIFSKGYGLAHLSYDIPNDQKMVYNIGSVSKQFLGYAYAMLHVEGSLNLDDPVNKYLEDWPEFEHPVTLRHLLTHTSGYREAYTMSNLAGRFIGVDRLTREECLNVVRKQPQLEFIPGSRYTYNSTAWVILAEVFEKVKGQSAEDWIKSNILDPLGMEDTQIETYVGEVIENAAESYSINDDKGYVNEKSNRAIFGAADVFTSVEDLVKWINNYKTAEIGGKEIRDLFLDPFILNDGSNSEYALGIGNGSYRGLALYSHSGGHEAFITQLSYYPQADLGIIVISNFGGRGFVSSNKIVDILLKEQFNSPEDFGTKAIKIKKKNLEQFSGRYLISTLNSTLDLTIVDDNLTIDGRSVLVPVGQNTFRISDRDDLIKIETLTDGKTQLTSTTSNTINVYNRVDPWPAKIEELTVFEGDYWSDELETVYHLSVKDEILTIQHRWIGEVLLEPVTKDFFKTEWGFYLKFNRNTKGDISGLSIYSGRTLNVNFERKE